MGSHRNQAIRISSRALYDHGCRVARDDGFLDWGGRRKKLPGNFVEVVCALKWQRGGNSRFSFVHSQQLHWSMCGLSERARERQNLLG
jgi:hypothetical protein